MACSAYAIVGGNAPASHSCHFEFRLLALFTNQRLNAQLFLTNQYAGHFIWFWVIDNGIGEFDATIQWKISGNFQVLQQKKNKHIQFIVFSTRMPNASSLALCICTYLFLIALCLQRIQLLPYFRWRHDPASIDVA